MLDLCSGDDELLLENINILHIIYYTTFQIYIYNYNGITLLLLNISINKNQIYKITIDM